MTNNDIENHKKSDEGSDVYWYVGASFEEGDQTERFINNSIWENGYTDKNLDLVRSMNVGDTILIKSTYTRKYDLPFDNREHSVSVMLIKAIGTIVENYGDGRTIKVDWGQGILSKDEWYFYTYQPTIWKVTAENWKKKALIDFSVNNIPQDIDRFRNHGYWKDRFGDVDRSHQIFEWTGFYEELAEKLLQYKDNRKPLVEFVLQLAEKFSLLYVQGKDLQDICPFTVFGLFNRGITNNSRTKIAQELADFLQVSIMAPTTFAGIPLLNNQKSWFFAFEEERQPKDIDQLWEMFELAQSSLNDESNSLEIQQKLLEQYDLVSSQNQIGWNLSMGLYWIRPWNYLTLDQQSQKYIVEKLKIKIKKSSSKQRCTGVEYFDLLSTLEDLFQEDDYPIHSFPELSLEAYGGKVENNRESSMDENIGSATKEVLIKSELTNVILYGPPGTGKTYNTVERAVKICDSDFKYDTREQLKKRYDELIENKQILFVTFHQSFSYEDFVEGIRAKTENRQIEYDIEDGVFKCLCDRAKENPERSFVMIIDEINRGNIANIFGELITLLEPSKRVGNHDARSVILPYSKKTFSVPNNLYVIGTMNTSDHSLTKLDLALRRRFEFVELLPDYELLDGMEVHGVNIGTMLQVMNDRIEVLLGHDYLVGHSYFLELKQYEGEDQKKKLAEIFQNKIVPLLQEYFFEDWERIQWVLNDQNKKNEQFKFIKLMKNNSDKDYLSKLFGDLSESNHIPDRRYQINNGEDGKPNAFVMPEAYQQIIKIKEF